MIKPEETDKFAGARREMLDIDLRGRGIQDVRVLRAMEDIRREAFVPANVRSQAYSDRPLPIGNGQTISQPYIVALMTEKLKVNADSQVLEIGTGSGYQTAVLGKLAKKVFTIERFSELSESAQKILSELGINNVEFYVGDGSCGWPEKHKFDRIIVTAAVPELPLMLIEQLSEDGLIISPVGYSGVQELMLYKKKKDKISQTSICSVRFVSLLGKYGFQE